MKGKRIQRSVFHYNEHIAVFALREKISFTYKVYRGFQNSKILFIVALLYTLALSILICLVVSQINPISGGYEGRGFNDEENHFIKF